MPMHFDLQDFHDHPLERLTSIALELVAPHRQAPDQGPIQGPIYWEKW